MSARQPVKIEDLMRDAAAKFVNDQRTSIMENPMESLKILGCILAVIVAVVCLAVFLHRRRASKKASQPIDRKRKGRSERRTA